MIREVDLDRNTFLLRERRADASELPCEYAENDEEDVKSYLDKRVIVSGTVRTSAKANRKTMDVEVIEAVGADDFEENPKGEIAEVQAGDVDGAT